MVILSISKRLEIQKEFRPYSYTAVREADAIPTKPVSLIQATTMQYSSINAVLGEAPQNARWRTILHNVSSLI